MRAESNLLIDELSQQKIKYITVPGFCNDCSK